MGNLFNTLLINPILNLLVAFYQALVFLHIPYALGFAIILLTIAIRFLIYPLINSQLRASKKMQEIAPHVNRLKELHKGDSQRLQQETMKLYKDNGINPVAGCLPVIIQLPIIWALYSVLQHIVSLKPGDTIKVINDVVYIPQLRLSKVWDTTFFGLPLGQTPAQLLENVGFLILLVPLLTGVFQFIQSKMMFPAVPKQKTDKAEKTNDFAQMMQTQSLYILPVMIGYFSYQFPIGLSLYWNTFTIFGIIQQYLMQKNEGVVTQTSLPLPKASKKKEKKRYGK